MKAIPQSSMHAQTLTDVSVWLRFLADDLKGFYIDIYDEEGTMIQRTTLSYHLRHLADVVDRSLKEEEDKAL